VKKGTGDLEGESYEDVIYEGYGPGGVAVLCDLLTDNRNRTAGEIRKIFEVHGGNLGSTNCVAWMFERKGVFRIPASATTEERLFEVALEAGADDVEQESGEFVVTCATDAFQAVGDALAAAGIKPASGDVARVPQNTVDLDVDDGRRMLELLEALEEQDDVQNVIANFNVPDELLAEVAGG
jgi:YebC/PmpR family DNA-binding regulatory protein